MKYLQEQDMTKNSQDYENGCISMHFTNDSLLSALAAIRYTRSAETRNGETRPRSIGTHQQLIVR